MVNVITQSALVKFLEASMDQIEVLANARVEQLPIGEPKQVYSVTTQQTFWDAFQLMKKHVRYLSTSTVLCIVSMLTCASHPVDVCSTSALSQWWMAPDVSKGWSAPGTPAG